MQSADIADATVAEDMASSSQTPRRSTVSAMQTHAQTRIRPNNSQCTHMTITRLYTKEFRCSICLRYSPLGWLYRCTQDRELLLYDDLDRGIEDKIDKLCDLFKLPAIPAKRSPVARLDRLSFLEEITDEQLKTYSKEQLNLILKQRAQVLDRACAPDPPCDTNPFSSNSCYYNTQLNNSSSSLEYPATAPRSLDKPWLPLKGGECQFKCCHFCRQNMHERANLSLNGIADGDIPATAILGFGFHLSKTRPVALVKHVQILGLRPNPIPRQNVNKSSSSVINYRKLPPTPNRLSNSPGRRHTSEGLGIFTTGIPLSNVVPDREVFQRPEDILLQPHSIEQGFTSIFMSVPLSHNASPLKEEVQSNISFRNLSPISQIYMTTSEGDVPSKEVYKQKVASSMPLLTGGNKQNILAVTGLSPSACDTENEKGAMVELALRE